MARPRTPTNVLELRGAFKKNPDRARVDPPTEAGLGAPPSYLNKAECHIWKEIESRAPAGVLTRSDRLAVEQMCYLVYRIRTQPDDVKVAERNLLRSYLGQFGMTPADRAKISAAPEKPSNPFGGL